MDLSNVDLTCFFSAENVVKSFTKYVKKPFLLASNKQIRKSTFSDKHSTLNNFYIKTDIFLLPLHIN